MIIVEPVSGTVGAVVRGVDLSEPLDESTVADIRKAFLAHHVLFFSDQDLCPEAQMRVGRYFGELDTHPFVEGMESHPEVIEVITEPDDRLNFGGGWHSDVTFLEEPDLASLLYAIEVPPFGGDTLFANQHAAYEALSDTMKDLCGGRRPLVRLRSDVDWSESHSGLCGCAEVRAHRRAGSWKAQDPELSLVGCTKKDG